MRTFLLSVFWVTNFGNVIQTLVIASAGWIIFSGSYSFSDLNVNVFLTEYIPWLLWLKTILIALLGEFGRWVLTIPILVIAPLKFVTGTAIGLWAYSAAKNLPVRAAYTKVVFLESGRISCEGRATGADRPMAGHVFRKRLLLAETVLVQCTTPGLLFPGADLAGSEILG